MNVKKKERLSVYYGNTKPCWATLTHSWKSSFWRNDSLFPYLVCSLQSSGCIRFLGSIQSCSFRQDMVCTSYKTSDTHLTGKKETDHNRMTETAKRSCSPACMLMKEVVVRHPQFAECTTFLKTNALKQCQCLTRISKFKALLSSSF